MFGLLCFGAMVVGTVYSGLKAGSENAQHMKIAEVKRRTGNNRANIYHDRHGATRDLNTGKRVTIDNLYIAESKGKDAWMYDEKGKPIRNLSEEIRDENYRRFIRSDHTGKTVAPWKKGCSYAYVGRDGNPYASGDQYKDLRNYRVYVCRRFEFPKEVDSAPYNRGWGNYYMDIKTGLLVRETDSQKESRAKGEYKYSEAMNQAFIDYFNQKQSTTGYQFNSNIPKSDPEPASIKIDRMARYFCNRNNSIDS